MTSSSPPPTGRLLVRKLANATKSCAQPVRLSCVHTAKVPNNSFQARAYGACILLTYKDVARDGCKAEFELFKECVQGAVRPYLPGVILDLRLDR
ncbi:hypothetical protein DACRYDRAFT_58520 [Dacryopinax primogenitus]|uniref:IMS import disulfide relay-system CHCH-CHCH-like Cx9C domain-containing protein n=1 Tax=Dacryopinax primogenitus (strain DJM 731) TaxID=1858805 RepID=M5FWQ8_DACPD|nr:uncharacterized protein DACRYDRAFT_58520 [Dacryopinax primogenitus]EJT97876.1 hypothetical protein DACRYDRAFT_58520 [Dacryopinax primogenitus]